MHLHQGPKSIVIADTAPFPLQVNHIFTLPPPHIPIKTTSQVTIPCRAIAIIHTTFNGIPKLDCNYSFIEPLVPYRSQQHHFLCQYSKCLVKNCQYAYYVQLSIQVLITLSCLKPDTLVRWNCSVILMTPPIH